ncbi:MAG TPA: tripartite tricarboxylate transporter substrate binding protein [Xanthobacteraceae bacterium]
MATNRRDLLKNSLGLPLALAALPAGASLGFAQEQYPTRTVTMVVPFPAGGSADMAGRPVAAALAEKFGRNVVVENKGGAGGGVGHAFVARAEPDGHTLLMTLPSLAVIPEANRLLGQPVQYEFDQFAPIARVFADAVILTVKKSSPWKTLDDFVQDVRKNPGQIPYGSSGKFGTVHLAMEMFLNAAGLKMQHVPYQGGAPAFNALLSDQVPIIPSLESIAKGHLESGDVRVLAQWGTERLPSFKDAPTLQEAGFKDVVYVLWAGLFAPRATPERVQKVLRDAIRGYMQDPAVQQRFLKAGSQPGYLDAPEFAAFLKDDTARLLSVVRKVGLT